jgi:DNA-binding protein H-NS
MATKKKGNVTINPKKEDLMSETMNSNIRSAMSDIREKAAAAFAETSKKERVKAKTPQETQEVAPTDHSEEVKATEIDDSAAKKEISERMRQRLAQMTRDHDRQYMIDIADPK